MQAIKRNCQFLCDMLTEMLQYRRGLLDFFNVSAGRDAQSVYEVVTAAMAPFCFEEKLVAQTYDGAAVMASALNGLQAKVKAVAPSAVFVHCYAHRLNLVLSQGAKSKCTSVLCKFRRICFILLSLFKENCSAGEVWLLSLTEKCSN